MPEIIALRTLSALRAGLDAARGIASGRRLPAPSSSGHPDRSGPARGTAPRRWLIVGLAAVCLALATARSTSAQPAVSGDGAHHGYLAARMTGDGGLEVIDALNAGRFFVPASVLKVVTVAAALEHLGADYRWRTRLTSPAAVAGEVLAGDLVIEPGGDPTWSRDRFPRGAAEPLESLAAQVRARGIVRIRGDLVVDGGRFPGRPHPLDRSYGDLPYRYGTPPAALAVDDGTITVRVAPGASIGAPARVEAPDGVTVINLTVTAGRDRHGAGTLDFLPVWGTDKLLLRGEYPLSEPAFTVPASDPAPMLRAARKLRAALDEAGVTVDGGVRLQRAGAGGGGSAAVLAELASPPLDDLLDRILTNSHNRYADTLALTLGLEVAGTGRFDDGVDVVDDFASALADVPAGGRGAVSLRDGSGLSAANLVTPTAVVRVLAHAAGQPWGGRLIGALPTPGRGTLAAWPPLPPLAAKTGTLRHTAALAGILDPGSDAPVVFCYFVNHHRGPAAARRAIAAALRSWRAGEPAARP